MQLEYTPIRLQTQLIGNPPVAPIDANTNKAPQFWRASSVGMDIGIFDAFGNPLNLANLVASGNLQLSLFKNQGDPAPLWTKVISGGGLIPLITTAGWNNGTQQNCTFVLNPADTDQALGAADSADFWIVLNGLTSAGALVLYAAGRLTIFNAAAQLPPSTLPAPSYHAQNNTAGNTNVAPTSNMHTEVITVGGTARTSNIVVQQNGLAAGARVDVLIDASTAITGIILQFYLGSLGGANPFAFYTAGGSKRGLFRFYFDGGNLQPLEQTNPAY